MLEFCPIKPEDTAWLRPVVARTPDLSCDASVASLICWGNASIAACGDFFVPMVNYGNGHCYLRPLGGADFASILPEMIEDSRARGIPFCMCGVTKKVREQLQDQPVVWKTNRDYYDYVYTIESLCTLSGHKLQAKRNHINRFIELYPDWHCVPMTKTEVPICRALLKTWYEEHYALGVDPASFHGEQRAIGLAMDQFEDFRFEGLLLYAQGRPVAFSMGVPLGEDSFDVCYEKAFSSVQGAYAMINREFSRMIQEKYPNVRYLNREDDTGSEGLRKAKLSYHPAILLEKFTAFLPEAAQ